MALALTTLTSNAIIYCGQINIPPHTTLTDVTPEDKTDTVYSELLPLHLDSYILAQQNARETKRENEQEGGKVEKTGETLVHIHSATDIMPQKQFHNLICMGLF